MDKLIGKTINDRYIITEIIGVGGMAVVYKAFDKIVNRVVAVKVLKEEFMSDVQFRRRFANESKAITMLSQNNIVDVYDVCLDGDMMYLVMEYIDGVTLKEYLDKVKVVDWHEATFYIKQILKAMSHAHERGIVHRDIKPHNIMLLRDGTIKVTDFGIAKLSKFETQTITDKAIGSVHYISPEQASGDRTDEKTDIYAVGVMLYEMITGTLPFVADNAVSVALMQVQAQPKLPRDINPDIPEGIEEITIKAMMKDPSMRYASASAMFNDIVSVEANEEKVFGYLDFGDGADEIDDVVSDDSPTRFVDINNIENASLSDEDGVLDDEETDETENKFKEIWLPIILGVGTAFVVMAAVIAGIVFLPELKKNVLSSNAVVEKVTVDNYVGKMYDDEERANASGLVFAKTKKLSDQPEGTIIAQDLEAGSQVDKGSTITFTVSMGIETVQVPDITNYYYELGLQELQNLGIDCKTKYISSESVKENYIIKTDPPVNTEIKSDKIVTVYISNGSSIITVDTPDVVKRKVDDAVALLEKAGLVADKVYESSETVEKDIVISQSPVAGTKLEAGKTVVITVSTGPKVEEPIPDDNNHEDENPEDVNNEDENPEENPEDKDPEDKDPVEENPEEETPVSFSFSADMSPYKEEETVTVSISTSDNSWSKSDSVITMSSLAPDYIYKSDTVSLKIGTVVTFTVNGTPLNTYTVEKAE